MNCKIPFRPTEGREVLCSNCFEKNGPIDTRKPFEKQNFNRNDRLQKTNDGPNYQAQLDALNAKLDKILDILHSAVSEVPLEEPVIDEAVEETASNAVKKEVLEATSDVAEEKTEEVMVEKVVKAPKKRLKKQPL